MNILITAQSLVNYMGSETFTYTLAKELNLKHTVHVCSLKQGPMAKKFGKLWKAKPEKAYDLILISHNNTLNLVLDEKIQGFKIFTCHSMFYNVEAPKPGCDAYVAIIPEIQQYMESLDFKPHLIYNGINCTRFKPETPINDTPLTVFAMPGKLEALHVIREACRKLDIELMWERVKWNIQDYMNQADIVITLGRGACEGMACGRAVIVFDQRAYMKEPYMDGMITKENVMEIAKHNFSGRRYAKPVGLQDVKLLCDEIAKYDESMGDNNRAIALERFNVKGQVEQYLKIFEDGK